MIPVTLEILNREKAACLSSIKNYMKKIEEEENKIKEIDSDIQRLTKYENSPIEERTLKVYLHEQSKTVKVFDKFEELTSEGYQHYCRMLIRDSFYFNGGFFDLIVERLGHREAVGNITMTDFKKYERHDLDEYIEQELKRHGKIELGETVLFSKPYYLRAQNSKNRTGYGSEYYGDTLVYEGKLYGETTKYCFAGVVCTQPTKD